MLRKIEFIAEEADIKVDKITLLYFYARWMHCHKKMLLMLDTIKENYSQIKYYAIDTDYFPILIKTYKLQSLPTIIILEGKKELTRIVDLPKTKELKKEIARYIQTKGELK